MSHRPGLVPGGDVSSDELARMPARVAQSFGSVYDELVRMLDSGDSLMTGKLPVTLIWIRPLSSLGAVDGSNGEGVNLPSPAGSPRNLWRLL